MALYDNTTGEFIGILASSAPTPGGGSASALVGAIGMALGAMVGNLTLGKKKYSEVQSEIIDIMEKASRLQSKLLDLIDADVAAFEPLYSAYGIPKDNQDRARIIEDALKGACSPPMDIMRVSAEAIDLHEKLAKIGSSLAISDVGVGVAACKAALMGASLNVFINTKSMSDRSCADGVASEADALLTKYCPLADEIYDSIVAKLR